MVRPNDDPGHQAGDLDYQAAGLGYQGNESGRWSSEVGRLLASVVSPLTTLGAVAIAAAGALAGCRTWADFVGAAGDLMDANDSVETVMLGSVKLAQGYYRQRPSLALQPSRPVFPAGVEGQQPAWPSVAGPLAPLVVGSLGGDHPPVPAQPVRPLRPASR